MVETRRFFRPRRQAPERREKLYPMMAVGFTGPAGCAVTFGLLPGLLLDRAVAGTIAPGVVRQLG
jgi:hypothetical protein